MVKGQNVFSKGGKPPQPLTQALASNIKKNKRKSAPRGALQEIKKYQRNTENCIKKKPFILVCRDILNNVQTRVDKITRFQNTALMALLEASEAFMVTYFEATQLAAIHANRITIMHKDMHTVGELRTIFKFEGSNPVSDPPN